MERRDPEVIQVVMDEEGDIRVILKEGSYGFFLDMRGDRIAAERMALTLETAVADIRKALKAEVDRG